LCVGSLPPQRGTERMKATGVPTMPESTNLLFLFIKIRHQATPLASKSLHILVLAQDSSTILAVSLTDPVNQAVMGGK
jgi:hypothetical protein